MNIQPISTCTQNCRIKKELIYLFQLIMLPLFGIYFDAKPLPVAVANWRSSSGLLMGYPKGFASQDTYVTKLHRYTKNYPFMMLVSSKSTHVVSVRHSPAGNPGSPGRLKKRSSKPLESWIKDDSNRFKHYTLNPLAATELPTQLVRLQIPIPNHEVMPCPSVLPTQVHRYDMTWQSRWPQFFDLVRGRVGSTKLIPQVTTFNVQLGWMNSVEASVHKLDQRVRSTTWEFSANPPIGSIYQLYTTYILPFGSFWGVICYLDTTF